MRAIQPILILLLFVGIILYFSRLRSGIFDRVLVVFFVFAGMVMVIFPDLTMKLAEVAGVGRGADLFMYLALVGIGFVGLVLFSKIRNLEATISDLARTVAIQTAHTPDESADASDPDETT